MLFWADPLLHTLKADRCSWKTNFMHSKLKILTCLWMSRPALWALDFVPVVLIIII